MRTDTATKRRAALRCTIFAFLAIAASAAIPPSPIADSAGLAPGAAALASDVRLIVRYGDVVARSAAKTEAQAQGVREMSGVVGVKALPHLGMAVVHCESQDFVVPAFPPQHVSWSGDMDPRAGFVAGTLRTDRAENEDTMTAYNVYWQLKGSTALGPLLASIPTAGYVAPRCWVEVDISSTAVPAGAVKLIAQAGNRHGLGSGRASTALVSSIAATKSAAKPATKPVAAPRLRGAMAGPIAANVASAPGAFGDVAARPLASQGTSAPSLPEAAHEPWLQHLSKVLRMSSADAPIGATWRGRRTVVDFEVAPTLQGEDAGRALLDVMEARLLMLAAGGPSARRFDKAVASAFAALSSHVVEPSALRSNFGEVSQVPTSGGHLV